jgi:hypothetical protein
LHGCAIVLGIFMETEKESVMMSVGKEEKLKFVRHEK